MSETTTATREPCERVGRSPSAAGPWGGQGLGEAGGALPRHLRMAGDAGSLRDARHLVAEALGTADPSIRDTTMLLVGEVVTNAVVHGGGWFLLQVDATPERIRVEVTDSSAGQPRALQLDGEREHGRGLAIVDALADQWGTRHMRSHKVVWFELAHP